MDKHDLMDHMISRTGLSEEQLLNMIGKIVYMHYVDPNTMYGAWIRTRIWLSTTNRIYNSDAKTILAEEEPVYARAGDMIGLEQMRIFWTFAQCAKDTKKDFDDARRDIMLMLFADWIIKLWDAEQLRYDHGIGDMTLEEMRYLVEVFQPLQKYSCYDPNYKVLSSLLGPYALTQKRGEPTKTVFAKYNNFHTLEDLKNAFSDDFVAGNEDPKDYRRWFFKDRHFVYVAVNLHS